MASFKRILFPVEFSPQCQLAGPYVAAFARVFDAEVLLLHVEALPLEPYVWQPQTEQLQRRLERFLDDELAGLRVRRMVKSGDPAAEIVRLVSQDEGDLIMMPTHGRGAFRRFVLGSVTAKVLHDAPCPVWTSAHLDQDRPPAPPDLTSVVCAVDLDEVGVRTLRFAHEFARRFGSRLAVAHAVPAIETFPDVSLDARFRTDLMDSARRRLTQMQAEAGSNAEMCVGSGNIARWVNETAQSKEAGMVIIGRGSKGLMGRLRTHDYAIIRECECPVLSI